MCASASMALPESSEVEVLFLEFRSAEVAPVAIWTSVSTSLTNQLSGRIKYVFTFGSQSLRATFWAASCS